VGAYNIKSDNENRIFIRHNRLALQISGRSGLHWDTAERNILSGLQVFGMRDVFRSLHGYQVGGCSWVARRKALVRPRP
jgi:hypothetical protein